MTHPNDQQLMEFLYDEIDPAQRPEIAAHITACGECQGRVESWREARGLLQSWKLPEPAPQPIAHPARWQPMRYAAAALVFLAIGFGLARWSTPRASSASVDPAVVDGLRADLKRDLSVQVAALHQEYRAGLEKRIRQIEDERLAEYQGLRRDVETVALRTQEEFLRLAGPASDQTPAQSN